MAYSVSSFDVCCSGNERLRNRNEFILVTIVFPDTTADVLKSDLFEDLQRFERPDHFDYDGARKCVSDWIEENRAWLDSPNPFRLDKDESEDPDAYYGENNVNGFLYIADDSHEYSVWGD